MGARKGRWEETYEACISLRLNPRVLRPERIHNPSQAKINPRGQKCRRDSQAHNLHQEPRLLPLIMPAEYPSNITNDFQCNATGHGDCECGSSPAECIGDDEANEGDGEERKEGGVCGEGDAIEVVGGIDGAHIGGTCAVCVLVAVLGVRGACGEVRCVVEEGGHVG